MGSDASKPAVVTDEMVSRFLGWPLPKTFAPDCGISFDGRKDDEWNKNKTWPSGTNLFTADEARAMLEHVIGASTPAPAAVTDDELRKMWRDAGGRFHGPHIETGTMPESLLLPFLRNLATRTAEPPISLDWTEDEQWVRSQLQRMILSSRVLVGSDGTVTGYQIKTGALHKLIGRFTVNVPLGLPEVAASPTPDEQRAQAAQEGGCVEYCKAWPGCTCERSAAPLLGRWHHGAGNLCCGSIRIAHADFDTNPPDKFRDEVFDWVCNTLNAALAGRQQQ